MDILFDSGDVERAMGATLREMSTIFSSGPSRVDVFVPINSLAGKYAAKMHDTDYELGVGSQAKGGDVGRDFISRAIDSRDSFIEGQLERGIINSIDVSSNQMAAPLRQVGLSVQAKSRENAPRSPSKSQYLRTLKTAKGRKRSTFRATPGTLMSAIRVEVG